MSANSSSTNGTLDPLYHCFDVPVTFFISVAFTATKFLLFVLLFFLVLHVGHRRRRQPSHSDVFTFHMAAVELISVLGCCFFCCVFYSDLPQMKIVGFYALHIVFPGQTLFHTLTCVERYLAVVHPVTYLGLKQSGGVRIRNISCGCVWLLCFGWSGVLALYVPTLPVVPFVSLLVISLLVVSFCSLSVLCVLIRPGPGEVGGDRERVDQSKQRAFCTIMAILGALLLMFAVYLGGSALYAASLLSYTDGCVAMSSALWSNLPSSLVLPLLFLHRVGKVEGCSNAE